MERAPQRYRFDDVCVDLAAHRVEKAGVECPLEPKAFAVLVALLTHAGELVGRDELLDGVWQHRHVTPSVLSRVIVNLRRALGDDPADPRYIETVHGLGYRFAGTLLVDADGPPVDGDGIIRASASTAAAEPPRRRRGDVRRTRWSWLLLLLLLGVGALVGRALLQRDPAVSQPRDAVRSLAVLPFTTRVADPDLLAEAEGLSESLTDAFARRGGLRVAGRESAVALGRLHASAQKAIELLDVDLVLAGELRTVGNDVALQVRLWRRGDATPLWTDESSVPRAQLFRVVAPLIDRVTAMLPVSATATRPLMASVPTQDLYWLGRRYWYARTPESLARSLVYFRRAVEQDPRQALAYTGVADACMLLYEYGDLPLDEASTCARGAIARARELTPDLADTYASEALMLLDEGEAEAAIAAAERALQLDPRLPNARLWYGTALAYAGRVRDARDAHAKAEVEDPLNPILQTYLGADALLAGDEAAATSHLQRATELDARYVEPYWQIALQHQLHGRMDAAAIAFAQARERSADSDWNAFYEAYTGLLLGDAAMAGRSLDRASNVSSLDRYEALVWQRWLLGRAGELRGPVARPLAASASTVSARRHEALLARIALLAGDDVAARAGYDRLFGRAAERGDPYFRPWLADLGLGHFAAWIALLPDGDRVREQALGAYGQQLQRYRAGGVAVPVLTYQEALLAALGADTERARSLLGQAIEEGWLDATALRRDPAWRRYRDSDWLADLQRRIDLHVAAAAAAVAAHAQTDAAASPAD